MARTITSENPSRDVRRFLRYWASPAFVDPRLKSKHPGLGTERRSTKSKHISVHIEQGLEYLESAEGSSLLTKPLALFYAIENLAKAGCIFRDQGSDASDFKSHGLSGDQRTKRYSAKNLSCRIRSTQRAVWPAFFKHFNGDRCQIPMMSDGQAIRTDWVNSYATKPLKNESTIQLGWVLRHLPELFEDVALIAWGAPFVVHVPTFSYVYRSGPPTQYEVQFIVRHGHHGAVREMVMDRESDLLKRYERARDELDVLEYRCAPQEEPLAGPNLRMDVFGELYMDFARGVRLFGELVLYYIALFILSDVVRYQADQWLRLLKDHPDEALVIDRFLDIAVRKVPNLFLNELHEELFLFKFAR